MVDFIVAIIIGILRIILGIVNMTGNLNTLHSYHRNKVSEEDRLPFGKRVGLGTVICGGSLLTFGILQAVTYFSEKPIFTIIGSVILVAGLITGLVISFAAMKKYNKGIF